MATENGGKRKFEELQEHGKERLPRMKKSKPVPNGAEQSRIFSYQVSFDLPTSSSECQFSIKAK